MMIMIWVNFLAAPPTLIPLEAPMPRMRESRRLAARSAVLLVAAAVSLIVAACGSSSSGNGSSSSSGLSAADKAGLTKAQSLLAKYEQRPTQITSTVKISKPVPKGKTLYWIACGATPECTQEGAIATQAATLLGWKTVVLNNDGTTQQWKNDFNQVVSAKPAAVLYTAIPQALFASEVPALKKNGTFIDACCVTDLPGTATGIGYAIDVPSQIGSIGGAQAAFVASDSKDTGDSVIVNLPAYQILSTAVTDYKSGMATYCPTCKVSELDIALANIANATTTITSYLRAHPQIHYVVAATDGLTIGLPAALKAAGLRDVKIVGQGATPTNIQYLHSGEEAFDVAFPYYEALWSMVTAAAQNAAGVPVTASVAPPLWLLTPNNAPPVSAQAFPEVVNYKSQYEALWGVG
jgi:ABC-type sugar transport system substrate-binding protein